MAKLKKRISVQQILSTKYKDIEFKNEWRDLLGEPEMSGSWIIWGQSFNGKTSFCFQLAKELTKYGKVLYNSLEEGARKSMYNAIDRNNMIQVKQRFHVVQEDIEDLRVRLKMRGSANMIFIDSLQYADLNKTEYKRLKKDFPNKLFIFISHAEGKQPKGRFADFVRYDSDVKIRVEGFKAICLSRLGSSINSEYVIWQLGADQYWGENLIN